jgi:hypothetical protein
VSVLDLLDQDVFWISDGYRFDLVDMHNQHRLNLLEKLRREAYRLKIRADNEARRRGEPVDEDLSPLDWLETRPFVLMLKLSLAFDSIATINERDDDPYRRARTLLDRYERRDAARLRLAERS